MHVNAQFRIIARVHPRLAVTATVTLVTGRTVVHGPDPVTVAGRAADVIIGAAHAVVMVVTIDSRKTSKIQILVRQYTQYEHF